MEQNKDNAVDFLKMIIANNIDEAYEKYVDMTGKQHNAFTPAGMEALREGMKGAGDQFPDAVFDVKHVIAEDDLVAVHSHLALKPGEMEFAAVHMMRFKDGKIVEFWDIAQDIPDIKNSDGAF